MDAILPIEFLIPTLRVAKQLEWQGHEFSARLEDLEKLDEDRRLAVMGIYAKKRRQKRWHDQHVKTGRFRKGDLVLLYTLKKLKRKLKMRDLGPFVINELSPSGAVRLETLDGEPMANYINKSRLKLYHEPLTQEMLDRMHAAKTQKAQAELLKQKAKEEADERARAAKAKRLKAKMLTLSFKSENEEDQFVEPFCLKINLLAQEAAVSTHALIDSGADLNVISWEI